MGWERQGQERVKTGGEGGRSEDEEEGWWI